MKLNSVDMRVRGMGMKMKTGSHSHLLKMTAISRHSKEYKRPMITKGMTGMKTGHPRHERSM